MKKIKKLCAKSSIKPEFNYVKVGGEFMEATDAYRWARVKNKGYKDGYHHQKTGEVVQDLNYPDVNILLEGAKKDNTLTYRVNRKYLIEVLEALEKGDGFDSVDLYINPTSTQKIIYIKNLNGEALIMPMTR
jgi:hypothetical protein